MATSMRSMPTRPRPTVVVDPFYHGHYHGRRRRQSQGIFSTMATTSFLLTILWLITPTQALTPCFSIFDCQDRVGPGSECTTAGVCSNPYYPTGCLASARRGNGNNGNNDNDNNDNDNNQHAHRIRTCSSADPPEAEALGYCRKSRLGYQEIRIASQNWESVFFEAWILQIILSEILDVPVTIETGTPDANVDFYDPALRFQYGTGNDWHAMRTARQVTDCTTVHNNNSTYTPCFHVVPEVWTGGQAAALQELQQELIIEPTLGLGALGSQSWFVPKFTAESDQTLTTYIGLQGPDNRQKLAETFLRPTTWHEYCQDESPTQCKTPDGVATRPPDEGEQGLYFHGMDTFKGHFRNTTQNNCQDFPETCTGHIVDYPCGWSSYVSQQAHHLDIAIESNGKQPGSNGYSYGEMVQIWNAANATKSNVLMQWWQPEALFQEFLGTDAEFTRVSLPPPSQDCVEHRVSAVDRCSDDPLLRVGDPRGACHEAPQVLQKVISTALRDISHDPNVDVALHSPAYELIKNFRITDLQLGQIFDYWFAIGEDKWNLDPRDAVCQWVVENLEQLETFIPRTYPRVIEDEEEVYSAGAFYTGLGITLLAIAMVFISIVLTYAMRQKTAIRVQQVEFLFLLLVGVFLVSLGSLLNLMPPSNGICVSVIWFINFGYTLELVPLIVKINAVNRLMVAAQQMRRLELRLTKLYGAVAFIALLVGTGLLIWTVVDPPHKFFELSATDELNELGESIITRTYYCSSDKAFWDYLSVSWQLLLLLAASILAFQTRNITQDINETRTLASLIYSHFLFVILRSITYVMESSIDDQTDMVIARTYIYSADSIATVCIYFLPKFLRQEGDPRNSTWVKRVLGNPTEAPRRQSQMPTQKNGTGTSHSVKPKSNQPIVSAHRARDSFDQDYDLSEHDDEEENENISPYARPVSLRDNSTDDYKIKGEWEDPHDRRSDERESSLLEKVLEEEEEADIEADD